MRLTESLTSTEVLSELFSDRSVIRAMVDFEIALARVEARLGILPPEAAQAIASCADPESIDPAALARKTPATATPAISLIHALTEQVRAKNPSAADYVHWGATSQDVVDSATALLLSRAKTILASDLQRLATALRRLSEQHARTVVLSRTLLQAAPPVTFGLKVAGWLGAIQRGRRRLNACFSEACILQFGGASGTVAALGRQGVAVGQALAEELKIAYPEAPWHTHRDRLAALVCECGILTGSLGKMARDISLLMQSEVGEVHEPGGGGRGGSSAMPNKINPVGCAIALAQANRVPGMVSGFLGCMIQEHERGLGGWHAEWPMLSGIVQATGLALASMAEVAEGLTVDSSQMRSNIDATRGVVFAERAVMLLAEKLGRSRARKLIEEAVQRCAEQKRKLGDVLREMPEVNRHLDAGVLSTLDAPEQYLGVAEEFRQRLLGQAAGEPSLKRAGNPEE